MLCRNPNTLEFFCSAQYSHDTTTMVDYRALPRPTHNLAVIREGHAVLCEDGRHTELFPGDCLFVPKYARYTAEWYAEPRMRFQTIHFDYTWQSDPLANRHIPIQRLPVVLTPDIDEDYAFLHAHQSDTGVAAFSVLSRFFGLCGKLLANFISTEIEIKNSVQPALRHLTQNYTSSLHVRDLAKLCCLSESRFYTCFKETTGLSPIQYKNNLCIQHAMYALVTDPQRSIESISAACGFESPVYFRRQFKALTGSTPTEYRRAQMQI